MNKQSPLLQVLSVSLCVLVPSLRAQQNSLDYGSEQITEPLSRFTPVSNGAPLDGGSSFAGLGTSELAGVVPADSLDISTERLTLPLQPFVDKAETPTRITWSGFVKQDTFWDSRQIEEDLNGLSILFPKPKLLDVTGKDINAQGLFNMLAIQSLLRGSIRGPEILGAKTAAAVEGDWVGFINLENQKSNILGLFRLRHAFANFDWPHLDFMFGQYWHPLFVPECTPATLAFDGGTPAALNSRNPQIRLTYHSDPTQEFHYAIFMCMLSEGIDDFSDGPIGVSSKYAKDAVMPGFGWRTDFVWGRHYFGAGANLKRIRPRLVTDKCFKADETLLNRRGTIFAALNWRHFTVRTKLNLAQNATDLDMLGGYAVHSIDPITDDQTYANLTTLGYWIEFSAMDYTVEPGLYLGLSKNLGSNKSIITRFCNDCGVEQRTVFGIGNDIDTVFLAVPRVRLNFKNVTFGFELQYTRATFGTIDPCDGKVVNTDPVADVRLLLVGYYFF